MKKFIFIATFFLIIAVSYTTFSLINQPKNNTITIGILPSLPSEEINIKEFTEYFMKKNPDVNIIVQVLDYENPHAPKPLQHYPDIIMVSYSSFKYLKEENLLLPLSLEKYNIQKFRLKDLNTFSSNNKIYALPYLKQEHSVVYNRDIVRKFSDRFPKSLAELYYLLDNINNAKSTLPELENLKFPFLTKKNIDYLNKKPLTAIKPTEEEEIILEYFKNMHINKLLVGNEKNYIEDFINKRTVFISINDPKDLEQLKKAKLDFDYGVNKIPFTNEGYLKIGFAINKNTKNKKLCMNFLKLITIPLKSNDFLLDKTKYRFEKFLDKNKKSML